MFEALAIDSPLFLLDRSISAFLEERNANANFSDFKQGSLTS
jgi:hypothetical protein